MTEPIFIDVKPIPDSGDADCFEDVRKQCDRQGGTIQHGWILWEWPGVVLEGEFHGVWKKPDGSLLDVSKKPEGEQSVLFAPDPSRVFAGRKVPNFFHPIGTDPRIKQWISLTERYHRMIDRQFKDTPFGSQIVVEGEAFEIHSAASSLAEELERSRAARRAERRECKT